MNEFERDVLRVIAGEDVPGMMWGAAMSEAVEYLQGRGFCRRVLKDDTITYEITDRGREALRVIEQALRDGLKDNPPMSGRPKMALGKSVNP